MHTVRRMPGLLPGAAGDEEPRCITAEKIRMFRELIKATDGLKAKLLGAGEIDRKLLEDFTKAIFECTTCGACGQNCTVASTPRGSGPCSERRWCSADSAP